MRTVLICEDYAHAEAVDQWIMEHLRESEGAHGGSWSGVYSDGVQYGVLWGSPASSLFGDPATDPSVVLSTSEDWQLFTPAANDV